MIRGRNSFERGKQSALKVLNYWKIIIPLFLGIAITIFLMYRDRNFSVKNFLLIKEMKLSCLFLAIIGFLTRDFFYVCRIRLLTGGHIAWVRCAVIIVLWEFLSCVTPSVVGGGVVAVFLFMAEGIPFGRAIAYVLATSTFDNFFFLFNGPMGIWTLLTTKQNGSTFILIFICCYFLVICYVSIMTCALFFRPKMICWVLKKVTSFSFLKRFQERAEEQGHEMIIASKILSGKGFVFWGKIFIITILAWYSRYIVLNFLIESFISCNLSEHFYIFRKHLIMWVPMLLSPTPGGAGLVEYFFNSSYKTLLLEYTPVIMLLWRLLTFYIYIFSGTILIPFWIRKFRKNKKESSSVVSK